MGNCDSKPETPRAKSQGKSGVLSRSDGTARSAKSPREPPVAVKVPSVGREVVIYGITDKTRAHLNGQRGRVCGYEQKTLPKIQIGSLIEVVRPEHLLGRTQEVVAYYSVPVSEGKEVRWFVSHENHLLRWAMGTRKNAISRATSLSFRLGDKLLRDQDNEGGRLPPDDWKRIISALVPAADRCGVGHNLPMRELKHEGWWHLGAAVEALWGWEWHPGTISAVHADGDVDVLWEEDGTQTPNVRPGQVRPWLRKHEAYYDPLLKRENTAPRPDPSLLTHPALDFDDIYETGRKLGEGGFGEVYEVRHRASGVRYAAKVLPICRDTKDESREVPCSSKDPIRVGDRVQAMSWPDINEDKRKSKLLSGVVAYLGTSPYSDEDGWAGVVLDVPCGSHDGSLDGRVYFEAPPLRGAFIRTDSLRMIRPHVVELWSELDHPHLCRLVDWRGGRHAYTSSGRLDWSDEDVYGPDAENYMVCVMEICDGGDLEDVLKSGGSPSSPLIPINECSAASTIRNVLSCLAYMHSKGLVHHDLKVSNVLLREKVQHGDSLAPQIRLCDLGLSKFAGDMEIGGGTLLYMAPELLMAWRWRPSQDWSKTWEGVAEACGVRRDLSKEPPAYDQKIDIFAAGVVCYYLITRGKRHPFHLDSSWPSLPEVEHLRHLAGSIVAGPRFPDTPWKKVSKECKDFISSLLAPNASDRPSAVQALQHPWVVRMARTQPTKETSIDTGDTGEEPFMEMGSLLARMRKVKLREQQQAPRPAPPKTGAWKARGWRGRGAPPANGMPKGKAVNPDRRSGPQGGRGRGSPTGPAAQGGEKVAAQRGQGPGTRPPQPLHGTAPPNSGRQRRPRPPLDEECVPVAPLRGPEGR